jgi:ribose transport system ATP-binding protein
LTGDTILQLEDIEKSFNGIPVLKKANFSLKEGEVHALMGGNGAGKSTLMKILTGVYTKDAGTIKLEGKSIELDKPKDANDQGISIIFQELSLVPTLTVAQNIFLKREPKGFGQMIINYRECNRRAQEILNDLNVDIDPKARVESLGVGYMQMVEIAKALSQNARILIMDEPTSSLSESETRSLFQLVERLKNNGISIVYISHRMSEIFEICDRVTVLRDGTDVLTEECKNLSMEQVVDSILGDNTGSSFSWKERSYKVSDTPLIEVKNLSYGAILNDVNFEIHAGEIVGMAGLMGSGRTEIAESIFGLLKNSSGDVLIDGKQIKNTSFAMEQGIALVPEDRRRQGLILDHSLRDNLLTTNLFHFTKYFLVNDVAAKEMANNYIEKLNIKTDSPDKIAKLLSGGNQQKIVLAKWLARDPRLLILDEPTMGVDIGAKSEILEIIRSLADRGIAVLVISSELTELLAISDRLLILHNGKISKQLQRRNIESEEVLHHAIQGY